MYILSPDGVQWSTALLTSLQKNWNRDIGGIYRPDSYVSQPWNVYILTECMNMGIGVMTSTMNMSAHQRRESE